MWDECNCEVVWAFFGIDFVWDGNENWPFPVLWPLPSFPYLLAYWVQHFHSVIFQDLKSLNWNPSPPLPLFIVMLPKAHLTSHSRMSGSRSVIRPSWLSESWRSFLYSSLVYSSYPFLISSASVRSTPFLSFIEPIFAWNIPLVSLIFALMQLSWGLFLFWWQVRNRDESSFLQWGVRWRLLVMAFWGFPGGSDGKESACNVGDLGSIPGIGKTPWGKKCLQYSCLGNSIGRGAWQVQSMRLQSLTPLSN